MMEFVCFLVIFLNQYHKLHKLYVCEYCLKYMKQPQTLEKHSVCDLKAVVST